MHLVYLLRVPLRCLAYLRAVFRDRTNRFRLFPGAFARVIEDFDGIEDADPGETPISRDQRPEFRFQSVAGFIGEVPSDPAIVNDLRIDALEGRSQLFRSSRLQGR